MKVYQPTLDDLKLERLWETMALAGDLRDRFPPAMLSLVTFLNNLQPPTTLIYEEDEQGIWLALWMEPTTLKLGIASLWLREDKRKSRAALQAIILGLHHFFEKVEALLAYTCEDAVLATDQKVGFELVATLPGVFFDKPAHMMVLTRERFEAGRHMQREA